MSESSILRFRKKLPSFGTIGEMECSLKNWERDPFEDISYAVTLCKTVREELEKLHPVATEMFIKLVGH